MTKRKIWNAAVTLSLAMYSTVMLTVPVNAVKTGTYCPAPSPFATISSDTVSPNYVALTQLTASLEISNSGCATCKGNATASQGYTCDVTLALQQKTGSKWETIKEWTSSGRTNIFNKNWYVESGHDYRVVITAEVYNSTGNLSETASIYSNTVHY